MITFNWKAVFGLSTLPLIYILFIADGGIDPAKAAVHLLGNWAVIFLILTLSATPLMRVFRQRTLMQHRRQLGLWTFFYSFSHLSFYFIFLLSSPTLTALVADIVKRPYILVGFVATLFLTALAITSTKGWQRRLKSKWLTLHKAIYLIAILVGIHWWMTLRSDIGEWALYMAPLVVLLAWRLKRRITK